MEGANLMQSPIVKELITCEVCAKFLVDPRVLPCQHSFCLDCLENIHALRQADSHIKLGSLRCPTCRTIVAIPLGGLGQFPIDKKVEKVRELVDELLIQSIITKSVSDSRTSLNSSSFLGQSVDDVYGSRASMYDSNASISTKVTNTTQTDVSWEDLSQGAAAQSADNSETKESAAEKSSPNRRRRRRPKPSTEETMESDLFISEPEIVTGGSASQKVNGKMKDIPVPDESEKSQNCDPVVGEANGNGNGAQEEISADQNNIEASQNGGTNDETITQEAPQETEAPVEEEDPIQGNMIYELSEHVWEAVGYDYNMPTSMAFLSDGTAVVAEYGNSHIQFFTPDGKFLRAVEEVKPYCVCVDGEDRILVGDRRDKTLRMFDSEGEQIMSWELDLFKWISGIGITSSWKYVICEREKCKLGVYEPDGQLIKEFGSHGYNDTQFSMADFLVVDSKDRIILCDSANHCVKIFDLNGKFLRRFGERGSRNGQLEWPKSVCLDHRDNILVSDKQNNRISMFSPDGEFIQHLILDYPQPYAVAFQEGDPSHFGVTRYDLKGQSTISVFSLKDKLPPATED